MRALRWVLVASLLTGFLMTAAAVSYALSQGPNSPTTAGNDAAIGSAAWSFPTNVTSSDDSSALTTPGGVASQYLEASGFGFSLPPTAVVQGIAVTIERRSAGGTVSDNSVKISKGGTVGGTEHAAAGTWGTTDLVVSYGSASDLWGLSWTAADINAAGFGVAVSAIDSSGLDNAAVDHMTITVTYSLCGDSIIEGSETCDDGNTTNGDCCSSTCQLDASGTACTSDGNLCTDDECDGVGTCQHLNNTDPCDDGDPCTNVDQCSGGSCVGSGFCLDRFKCYQGKDLKNPQFVKLTVNTADQLSGQSVEAKKVKFVCDAVDVNGAGTENPNAALTCYLIKAANLSPRPNLEVSTQFQTSQFQAKKGKLLCLPSTLSILP